jgi:hypothetical protein
MAKAKNLVELIEGAAIRSVPLDHLHLDPDNPRLPTSVGSSDKEILNYIASTTAIEDLVNAIATNGFFPGEPLVVVPHSTKPDHFIVVEGNRRLTSLRLLQDPNAIDEPSGRLKEIVEGAAHKPTEIPVVVRGSRSEVLPYLGFRHITGVTAWEPLAKARYMKQLFDELTKKSDKPELRYRQIARAIGTRAYSVRRNLDALAVYHVMEKADFFGIPDLSEDTIKFGLLYTALADENIASFVGATRLKSAQKDAPFVPTHPIVTPNVLERSAIKDLSTWLFNKKDGETVVGESRNLRKLALVVSSATALKALKSGSTLDYAYRITTGVEEDFTALLFQAESNLREAAGIVATVDFDESILKLTSQLGEYVALIEGALESKRATAKKKTGGKRQ